MRRERYLTAAQAAEMLGISLPTLYSYVSRGLIRSETADIRRRTRRYDAEDVARLQQKQEQRRDPGKAVDAALHWDGPALDSAITLIDGGCLYYRGQDALKLAEEWTAERTAALIWTGDADRSEALFAHANGALPMCCLALLPQLTALAPVERVQTLLPLIVHDDLAAYDLRPAALMQTGARLLRRITAAATGAPETGAADMATALQRAWAPSDPAAAGLLRSALILCADHELNVSAFTARCAASAGAPLHQAINAGLSALQGAKHGGACERVEALLEETGEPEGAPRSLSSRVRRGEGMPGFGHRLYPQGDPRGRFLLARAQSVYPASPAVVLARALAEEAETALDECPNLDFGLTVLCRAMGLPPGSAIALFALGRAIGWIGHAIEEYSVDRLIRPRAHYVGLPAEPCRIREG